MLHKRGVLVMLALILILLVVIVIQQNTLAPAGEGGEGKGGRGEEGEGEEILAGLQANTPTKGAAESDIANADQCSQPYQVLSDTWRKIDFKPTSTSNCDSNLDPNWYRFAFNGNDSYAKIPSSPPAKMHPSSKRPCGTHRVAWTFETLPSAGEPLKNITIHWSEGYWN